ncbi:MAG: DsbA family protein, partial [Reichenbachiella sp.]
MEKDSLNCEDGVCEVPNTNGGDSLIKEVPNKDRNKLLYFGDPMCSWCWGITNHLEAIVEDVKDTTDFELVLGGLRPGGGDEWNEEMKEMLKSHWGHVNEASGQPFDYDFFNKDSFNYDTEPPSRAVRVVRDLSPAKEWSFYKSLQKAFYAENRDIHDLNVLEEVCNEHGVDFTEFEPRFLSQEYKKKVY